MEHWKAYRPVVADSLYFDEEHYPYEFTLKWKAGFEPPKNKYGTGTVLLKGTHAYGSFL
jgi:hypothetical protein